MLNDLPTFIFTRTQKIPLYKTVCLLCPRNQRNAKPTGLTTDAKPTGLNRFTREQLAKQARSDLTRTCLYYQTNSYRSGGPSK